MGPIGGYANEGDVIALIETDKVTVDIKAEESGVVITHYGNVDDNVEVGSITTATATKIDTPTEETTTTANTTRIPSIQLLGKEGWMKKLQGIEKEEEETEPQIIYMDNIDPMFGRPSITDEEMDALILGGASLAPELIQTSKHPVFK